MSTALRLATVAALALCALLLTPAIFATTRPHASVPQDNSPEAILFNAANHERQVSGLQPFQWDPALAAAARTHADRLVQMHTLSHQFSGEPPLQERAMQAGARFSLIAENIAQGVSAQDLHTKWMNSPAHRANLLDHELNAIGIAVIQSGNYLFAVQDFSVAIPQLSFDQQESQVGSQLAARGLKVQTSVPEARQTCAMDRGSVGEKPLALIRYEVSDLTRLPDDIEQKVRSGKYRAAVVGACDAGSTSGFTRFRIAILLY